MPNDASFSVQIGPGKEVSNIALWDEDTEVGLGGFGDPGEQFLFKHTLLRVDFTPVSA